MAAGQLRERVRFERRITGPDDGYGNTQMNWVPLVTMAARIDPESGSEQVIASKLQGIRLVEITVRWCEASRDLKESDRAIDVRNNAVFNIRSVENSDERRRYVSMLCSWGDAHG